MKLLKPILGFVRGSDNKVGTQNELVRQQWVIDKLNQLPPSFRLLDAGAGEQQYRKCCEHLQYVSQDFAQYDGVGNNSGLQTGQWNNSNLDIISDITNIPEKDASFDVILCTEVFEHLPNPILAIKEFSRLLKDGGQLIITAPFCSLTHFAPFHFYSGFNRYFYQRNLAEHNFEIVELEANGNYFEYIAQEARRVSSISEQYLSAKPNFLEKLALTVMLNMLNRFSRADSQTNELLNYGFHVRAIKKAVN